MRVWRQPNRHGGYTASHHHYQGQGEMPPLFSGFVVELCDCPHSHIPNTFRRALCDSEEEARKKAEEMADRMVALHKQRRLPDRYTNRLVVIRRLTDDARVALWYVGYSGQGELAKRSFESVPGLWNLMEWQDHTIEPDLFIRGGA